MTIVGADVGGTFTDLVAITEGRVTSLKLPTSSPQSTAVAEGTAHLAGAASVGALVHGTTVATNALLERAGATTALVTDRGFEDVLEIGRQHRPSLYDPDVDRPVPLVSRSRRVGVEQGDAFDLPRDTEAVAVALIAGHVDAAAEAAIAAEIERIAPGIPVSLSSVVAPEFREFERISTTVMNAYLTPITASYLRQLRRQVIEAGVASTVAVMRSSGGLMSLEAAADLPAAILLSGPAGGVVAAQRLAEGLGLSTTVSFDMGGTSTDVCLIEDGAVDVSHEREIDGHACRMPAVGIHTVGAGGGSIAWIDAGGSLRVGPQSAGADPGPACYGHGGTQPTVTDANVVLGRIGAETALGGSLSIDASLARDAVSAVGDALGLSTEDAAVGIVRIAEATMAGAVRTVLIDAGSDPTRAHLVAFGGAGGLHAAAVARSLGMAGVVVPPFAGVFSAVGLLVSSPRTDAVAAIHVVGDDLGAARKAADVLVSSSLNAIIDAGSAVDRTELHLDLRYVGQAHEVSVPWDGHLDMAGVVDHFEALHRKRYGFDRTGDPTEIMAVRCSAFGVPPLADIVHNPGSAESPMPGSRRVVAGAGEEADAVVLQRPTLPVGFTFDGPAVIEEEQSTTWVDSDERFVVAGDGSLVITW